MYSNKTKVSKTSYRPCQIFWKLLWFPPLQRWRQPSQGSIVKFIFERIVCKKDNVEPLVVNVVLFGPPFQLLRQFT